MKAPACRWTSQHWVALTVMVVVLAFVGGLWRPDLLPLIGVYPLSPKYYDLIAILAAGQAAHLGMNVYVGNPLDPSNRPHVYGPWWLVTGWMGLTAGDAWWLGFLLGVAFLVVAAVVLNPRDAGATGISLLLLISPPVMLATERGNNDLVVFLLLVGAVWGATRFRWWGGPLAGGLVMLAAALKLYPLAAWPALAATPGSRRRLAWLLGGTLAACAAAALATLPDYLRVMAIAPEPLTVFGHGLRLTWYLALWLVPERPWLLLGAVMAAIPLLVLCWRRRRDLWTMVPATGFTAGCYVAGALTWAGCYLTTSSFPYRMLLLLLPARLWLAADRPDANAGACRLQLIMTLLFFWSPWLKARLLGTSPDGSYFTGSHFTWTVIGAEQSLNLVLALSLCLAVLGWAWRRLQSPAT